MKVDYEYYIPENLESEILRSVSVMAKEVLQENDVLENIFQKYTVAYNNTIKERCSVKSLKIMNQNHKPIFSSITSSGVIKSPFSFNDSIKLSTEVTYKKNHQLRTPLKASRINSKTERKRLSFDIADSEDMKSIDALTKDSDDCRMMDTSSTEERNPSLFNSDQKAKICASSEEKFCLENPDCVANLPIYFQKAANLSINIRDQDQAMTLENKKGAPENSSVNDENKPWYLQCRPSFLNTSKLSKATDTSDLYKRERFSFDGKPETITSQDVYGPDSTMILTKSDNHQMFSSPKNKNTVVVNETSDGRSGAKYLATSPLFLGSKKSKVSTIDNKNKQKFFRPFEKHETLSSPPSDKQETSFIARKVHEEPKPLTENVVKEGKIPKNQDFLKNLTDQFAASHQDFPALMANHYKKKNIGFVNDNDGDRNISSRQPVGSFFSYKKIMISNVLNTNEQKSFCPHEKHKTSSSITGDEQETSSITYKIPDEHLTLAANADKEKILKSQDLLKKVTIKIAPNFHEFSTLPKDGKTPNSPKMKQQKSTYDSKESSMTTCLVPSEKGIFVPGIFKIDDKDNMDVAMDSYGSISSIRTNSIDKIFFPNTYSSIMDDNDSLKSPENNFMDEEGAFLTNNKSIVTSYLINPNERNVTSLNFSKKISDQQSSATKDFALYISPESIETNMSESIQYDFSTKNIASNRVSHKAKDVESLTSMQNLGPSVKRFSDGTFQKSKTNGSVGDESNLASQLNLQNNLSKTSTPPKEGIIFNVPPLKPEKKYSSQAFKFTEMLTTRVDSFVVYFNLFIEDQNDLRFICAYITKIIVVIKKIPMYEDHYTAVKALNDFISKMVSLQYKVMKWQFNVERDLLVWDDFFKKMKQLQQDVIKLSSEEKNYDLKDFKNWEESYRTLSKKANDMTLIREIRKPTILHFGYELEKCIQLFIRYMVVIGILKQSSKISSGKNLNEQK